MRQLDDVVDGSNPSFWVTVEEDEKSKYNNAIYVVIWKVLILYSNVEILI